MSDIAKIASKIPDIAKKAITYGPMIYRGIKKGRQVIGSLLKKGHKAKAKVKEIRRKIKSGEINKKSILKAAANYSKPKPPSRRAPPGMTASAPSQVLTKYQAPTSIWT